MSSTTYCLELLWTQHVVAARLESRARTQILGVTEISYHIWSGDPFQNLLPPHIGKGVALGAWAAVLVYINARHSQIAEMITLGARSVPQM